MPLFIAVERNPSHDGIRLPAIVRECIDFIEEKGLIHKYFCFSSYYKIEFAVVFSFALYLIAKISSQIFLPFWLLKT